MEQMNIRPDALISVDYENQDLPSSVQQFKPPVFREGNSFCVLLGPDPQSGIFGCGRSVEEALRDWDNHLADEIDNPREDNETTQYIMNHLNTF